jgi:hypothetical protein
VTPAGFAAIRITHEVNYPAFVRVNVDSWQALRSGTEAFTRGHATVSAGMVRGCQRSRSVEARTDALGQAGGELVQGLVDLRAGSQ